MLVAAKDMLEIKKLKLQLREEFEMKNLGVAKKIFGIKNFRGGKKKLWVSQRSYIQKVLARFIMENAKSVATPLATYLKLSTLLLPSTDIECDYMSQSTLCECSWKHHV